MSHLDDEKNLYTEDTPEVVQHVDSAVIGDAPYRGLQKRHLSMSALAGVIGTGLFLATGSSIARAGPLGAVLAYTILGFATAFVAYATAELSAFMPVSGGFVVQAGHFLDRSMSISTGWIWWYSMASTMPAELTAASSLFSYWRPNLSPAVMITVLWFLISVINFSPVRAYGEFEFYFALLKLALVVALIIAGLVLDLGGVPGTPRYGFLYWQGDLFNEYLTTGSAGKFLGFWSVMLNAAFALGNVQIVGLAAAETIDPRKAIPRALRATWVRIIVVGIATVFVMSMVISSKDPALTGSSGVFQNVFIIALTTAGVKVLPSVANAIILTSAFSCGNSCLFMASRSLHGMAQQGNAPKALLRLNRFGIPWVAVAVSNVFGALAYMAVQKTAYTVFYWLVSVVTTAALIAWIVLCITYLRFLSGLKTQGISRDRLPYKAPLQPYATWFALIIFSLILFFSGFDSFSPEFSPSTFFANYSALIIFVMIWIFCKVKRVDNGSCSWKWVSTRDMDFESELAAIEMEKEVVEEPFPYSRYDRILNSVF